MFLLLCGYFGNSVVWAIIFLSLSVGCSGIIMAGGTVNSLDLAPKYAGILLGISNTIGTIPGFLGPQIAKLIAKKVSFGSSSCRLTLQVNNYYQILFYLYVYSPQLSHVETAVRIHLLLISTSKNGNLSSS